MFHHKKHLFFDLDHTLWDYDTNCVEAIEDLYEIFNLEDLGIPSAKTLSDQFFITNDRLWDLYDSRQITTQELRYRRFREIFDALNISGEHICDELNDAYLDISPQKPHLINGAREMLEYLKPKYKMHIITNGFDEIQGTKMTSSGINHFFENIITSQKCNFRKPEKGIFEYALNLTNSKINEALMIGDNLNTDILGAKNYGIDSIYFSPKHGIEKNIATKTIKHLVELKEFL
jgi:YjjG family noncanonical pyrimidine nucleotidase